MNSAFRYLVSTLIAISVGGTAAMSQASRSADKAIDVVKEVFRAYEAGQWNRVAALVHPEGLQRFRTEQLGMAHAWQDAADAEGKRILQEHGNPSLIGFPRIRTLQELEQLTPTDLYARWLEGHELKPENYDDGRPPVSQRSVLGTVIEGDTLVHVLYRIHTDVGRYGRTNETEVITAKRDGADWRVLLNKDLSLMGYIEMYDAPQREP
jgi:hypothetical protein